MVVLHTLQKTVIFSLISIFSGCLPAIQAASHPYLQAIHVLDPEVQEFKYHNSWNADQWVQWVRNLYNQDLAELRRNRSEGEASGPRRHGQWVNIIIIATPEEINSAFSQLSTKSYPDDKPDFLWSDISFPVFVVVRKSMTNQGADDNDLPSSHFNVFNCSDKKMYINAQVDVSTFIPLSIKHLFPKKVKNPIDTLRIPLITCTKVGKARGLLDEIMFQLKSR